MGRIERNVRTARNKSDEGYTAQAICDLISYSRALKRGWQKDLFYRCVEREFGNRGKRVNRDAPDMWKEMLAERAAKAERERIRQEQKTKNLIEFMKSNVPVDPDRFSTQYDAVFIDETSDIPIRGGISYADVRTMYPSHFHIFTEEQMARMRAHIREHFIRANEIEQGVEDDE